MVDLLNILLEESESELPDADCENCNYFVTSYIESTNQWCYMFEESPGLKCAQFKQYGDKG